MTRKILFVHQLSLTCVSGVRAFERELLWRIPKADPETQAAFEAYEGHRDPDSFLRTVLARHHDVANVVAINGHVDLKFDFTVALLNWAARAGRGVQLYVHDFWPQHAPRIRHMRSEYGCGLLASTKVVRDAMAADGLEASLVQVGVPLDNLRLQSRTGRTDASVWTVGSIGRVVPRKRFQDVVTGFAVAALRDAALLELRLLPSGVRSKMDDDRLVEEIFNEAQRIDLADRLRIVRRPGDRADYRHYDLYVCASSYEGFSMTPIEAAYSGCAPLMSDIPAHQAIAAALFPRDPDLFLFPVGDPAALGRRIAHEALTRERNSLVQSRLSSIRTTVESRWSVGAAAQAILVAAGRPVGAR